MNSIKSILANANELKRQGQLNQAIGQYYRAIQLNDKCSWSYYYLGETLTEYGNTDDAIHAYELAIELQPKQPWFHHALGELHYTRTELELAAICFRKAIDLNNDFYFSHQKLQETLERKKKEVDYQGSQDIKRRKLLIVGNPRCGSGYMHKIFQECGFRIGHEKDMQDGISCWFFAVDSKTAPGGNEANPGLSRNHFYFEKTVHHVRDPKTAIPSTLMLIDNRYAKRGEKVAMDYIYKHILNYLNIDVENMEKNLDRAIASFVYWNKIIEFTIARSAVFKVENCELDVLRFIQMNSLVDLKTYEQVKCKIYQPELKQYNNSLNKFKKPKPIIDDSMWLSVDQNLKKELNVFCDKYGYERIFTNDGKIQTNKMKINNLEQIKKQRDENLLRAVSNQLQSGKDENAKKTYNRALSLEFNYAQILTEIWKLKQKDRITNEVFKETLKDLLDYQNNDYFDVAIRDKKVFSNLSHKKLTELFINAIKLLKPNYLFDIGSYDGSASIEASKALSSLKAIAFEANISNYSNWKDREEFKQLSINYQNKAISNYNGVINFNIPIELKNRKLPKNHGIGSLMLRADDPNTKYQVIEVNCTKLDDFCLENSINLDDEQQNIALWIDVEGAAMQVLEGCSKCLSRTSLIFIEVEEYEYWQDSASADDIINELISRNFIPVARDYNYHKQFNLLFVNFNKLNDTARLINSFYNDLQLLSAKIKSDDIVSQKTRTSKKALEIIKAAITQRKPFSFIRIGDGEATILGYNRDISRKQVDNMTKLWWGQELAKDESIESLRTELLKSVNYADMLGIFDPVLDSKHLLMESQFILSGKMVRKYCDLKSINSFVSASDHLDWHDQNLIANLVDGQEIMTLITCRDIASKVADKFSVKTVIWLPIPAEAKYAGWQEVGYLHYPNRMKEILSQIQPLFKGHLFLVGAGILGKIYCRVIKERGGIALDLGSVFDNWAGHTKRPSVRRHRIGV